MSSSYRIATICPAGMSRELKRYLSRPVKEGKPMRTRDLIALKLLHPFRSTDLPFCCTSLGWASPKYDPSVLNGVISSLAELKTSTDSHKVSAEGFTHVLDDGAVQILGAYPLLDLEEGRRTSEYEKISFLSNRKGIGQLLEWTYRALVGGALVTDEFGVVTAVWARSESLAEKKLKEILALLNGAMYE